MGARTAGRESALKMLFGLEATDGDVEAAIVLFWREFGGDPEARPYADEAVRGVIEKRADLDETIRVAREHWRPERVRRAGVGDFIQISSCYNEVGPQQRAANPKVVAEALEDERTREEATNDMVVGTMNQPTMVDEDRGHGIS